MGDDPRRSDVTEAPGKKPVCCARSVGSHSLGTGRSARRSMTGITLF